MRALLTFLIAVLGYSVSAAPVRPEIRAALQCRRICGLPPHFKPERGHLLQCSLDERDRLGAGQASEGVAREEGPLYHQNHHWPFSFAGCLR